ncbi:MAG TPA: hypothetical protein VNR11_00515 [Xanthobacteraceae bacterium]|nr:hypothetical protein [Xanthobacteraceae bacterium]
MAKTAKAAPAKVTRTLHLKFTAPSADPKQLLALVQAARPFYEFFGGKNVRLLQNVDDPGRFVQIVEYETDANIEMNRQQIASDPRMQASLQMWRSMVAGGVEFEVYRDVSE